MVYRLARFPVAASFPQEDIWKEPLWKRVPFDAGMHQENKISTRGEKFFWVVLIPWGQAEKFLCTSFPQTFPKKYVFGKSLWISFSLL